jgi:hypothetical protein
MSQFRDTKYENQCWTYINDQFMIDNPHNTMVQYIKEE